MKKSLLVAIGCLVLATTSCDGSPPSMSGKWVGYDGDREVRLYLREVDGEVTGVGTIRDPGGTIEVNSGNHEGSDVELHMAVLYNGGYSFGRATGVFYGNVVAAQLLGLAFETDTITFRRLP